ncbi:hypothetical protein M409DRAFT_19614 [Zasmidium cellare ATCC 36951]|uniref:Uncharacterized protein n=1 Tax=Zasmidium cellare ATCC 36951 TaxID=1080233 RepID=A0A6A6CW24_ZASCE|nr:uncharacterized protein M409DRAFT_19614 [Zasmidium cellare ATCC 36951]KAF2169999.1 hypothetical protein M409DRAFT_19614 [Zasmidium cellare ATCC 36951]
MRPSLEQALLNVASTEGTKHLYLKLDEGRSSFGRLHGNTSLERYLNGPMHVPNKVVDVPLLEYYSLESTLNLLLAIADSCVPLRELHLPMDKFFSYEKRREEQVPEWDPEWFPHLQHKILRPFSHVHTIGLGDHAHRWLPPMSEPHLQDTVVNWFPALTSLAVPSYVDMRRLIATFPPGKFKHICIERCYYPIMWDQVRALLFHHRSSVVHVSLTKFVYKCRYERASRRLQDLLLWIADNLELQMLEFEGSKYHKIEFEGSKYHKTVYEDMKCAWQGDIKAQLSKFFESRYLFTKPITYVATDGESDDDDE